MIKFKWRGPAKLTCPKHRRFNPGAPTYHGEGQIKAGCDICRRILLSVKSLKTAEVLATDADDAIGRYQDTH